MHTGTTNLHALIGDVDLLVPGGQAKAITEKTKASQRMPGLGGGDPRGRTDESCLGALAVCVAAVDISD